MKNPSKRFTTKIQRSLQGFLVIMMTAFVFAGCEEAPVACFTVDGSLIDLNEEVTFTNCTEPIAKSYEWSFDDGTTSTEVSPKHTFTSEGQFLVALTAKAKVSANDDNLSIVMKVGQRIISSITYKALPSVNTTGAPWDANDGPDIKVLVKQGSTLIYETGTIQDASSTYPITLNNTNQGLVLAPEALTFEVVDDDGANTHELMASFTMDMATMTPNSDKSISLTQGNNEIEIVYTLR